MTTRDQLIFHLQEEYSFLRDFLPLLDTLHHEVGHANLAARLQQEREGIRTDLETLERALNVMGAHYKMERSAVAPGFKEAMLRFKAQMVPPREQIDIFALLDAVKVAQLAIGAYQGLRELARAVGEMDVATLLTENLQREQETVSALLALAPELLRAIGGAEARWAA
jgi:ferritin-like metal-binding protein YciE